MRTKKAFLNMSTSMVYQIIAIICGLITPRLILSNFGSTYNGVVASATQFLNMINILTLGITGATRVQLYKTLSKNDVLGTSRIMKATKQYMRKVGVAVIVYAVILCIVYPIISNNELSWSENATLIAVTSIGAFAQYFFGVSNTTLLQADQASYITNYVNIAKTILNTFCVVLLISLGCSIFTVKLGSSIVFLLAPIVLEHIVRKKYALIQKCEPDCTGIKNRNAVAFHSIANLIHDNTDIMLLTFFTDAKQISVYTVYYLVIGEIKKLLSVFTSGMEAAFGDMWAKGEHKNLNENFRIYEFLIYCFTIVIFSCTSTLILPFVEIYTRGVTDVSYIRVELAVLICLAECVFCVRQPYLLLVYATGNYEATKIGAMLEAIINLTVSLALVFSFGIPGVIIGTLVANVFRTIQYTIFTSKRILNRSINVVLFRVLWMIACFAIIIPLALLSQNMFFSVSGWLGWLLKAVTTFLIAIIITVIFAAVFYRSDLTSLIHKISSVILRKTGNAQ